VEGLATGSGTGPCASSTWATDRTRSAPAVRRIATACDGLAATNPRDAYALELAHNREVASRTVKFVIMFPSLLSVRACYSLAVLLDDSALTGSVATVTLSGAAGTSGRGLLLSRQRSEAMSLGMRSVSPRAAACSDVHSHAATLGTDHRDRNKFPNDL